MTAGAEGSFYLLSNRSSGLSLSGILWGFQSGLDRSMWHPKCTYASQAAGHKPQAELVCGFGDDHPKSLKCSAEVSALTALPLRRLWSPKTPAVERRVTRLSFCPAAMSGLAMVTDAPVLMVTWHGLSFFLALGDQAVTAPVSQHIKFGTSDWGWWRRRSRLHRGPHFFPDFCGFFH